MSGRAGQVCEKTTNITEDQKTEERMTAKSKATQSKTVTSGYLGQAVTNQNDFIYCQLNVVLVLVMVL